MGDTIAGILAAAAIIAALIVIVRAAAWLTSVLRKLARLVDDLTGEPPRPGFPEGRLGLLDRVSSIEDRLASLSALETRMAAVETQLRPNGGGSFRDAVDQAIKSTEPAGGQS
jgi:HAMP domain-containing protein